MLDYLFLLFILRTMLQSKLLWFLLLVFVIILLVIAWRRWWRPSPQKPKQERMPSTPAGLSAPQTVAAPPPAAQPKVETPSIETKPEAPAITPAVVAPEPEVSDEVPTREIKAAITTPETSPEAPAEKAEETQLSVATTPAAPVQPDDFTRIEGIGPKISSILHEAGIQTFAQLADTPVPQLHAILTGKIRIFFPDTWPEQAKLAAKGDWEALKQLQAGLKGGRRQ